MQLQYRSAIQTPLPDSYVLRMADDAGLLADFLGNRSRSSLDLLFNDASESHGLVQAPTEGTAKAIVKFFQEALARGVSAFVAQCQFGVGRSQAVIAAFQAYLGQDNSEILQRGSYNRKLYKLLMAELGMPVKEPLVSIVVRVKYDLSRIVAFMYSMDRQRHENWEIIAVVDGKLGNIGIWHPENKLKVIETLERKGRWGHPYRQLGIDAARGEYIGLQNDDNYLVPGAIEQLVYAMEREKADIAACQIVHSYMGWGTAIAGSDLGSWIAKASLVKSVPFDGIGPFSDLEYLNRLRERGRMAIVNKPLICHN